MYILLVLCSTSVHLTFLNRKQLDDRDIGSPKRVPKQEIKRGRGRGRERKIEGGKREGEERGGREGGEGGEAQVMGLVDVTVRITGGSLQEGLPFVRIYKHVPICPCFCISLFYFGW